MSVSEFKGSSPQIIRWVLITLAILFGLVALWLVKDILLLALTAIIFAVLLTSPIRFFVRRGVRRPLAVLLTIILIIVTIVVTTALILPDLFDQFRILATRTIPAARDVLEQQLQPENLIQTFPFLRDVLQGVSFTELTDELSRQLLGGLANVPGQVFPFLGNLVSTLISILIVIFLSLYFVADPDTHWRGLVRLVPLSYRSRAREILIKLDLTLRRFLQAQVLLMVLTGVATTVALILLRLPLSGVLGVITGLFSFIPNFGPLIALIPILAVAIINSPNQVLLLLLIFFAIQFLISQVVAPLMLGQEINMPPAMILLSQIMAGILFGFLGLLLSVPLAAMFTVLVREIYVRDILGDADVGQRTTREMEAVIASGSQSAWK